MTGAALTTHVGPLVTGRDLLDLASLVQLEDRIEVLDVGASPLVGEPPCYAPLVEAGLARVTAFEPDPEALSALQEQEGDGTRHIGHAVGDGEEHELRSCAAAGFSGLLEPDPEQLALLTDFPDLARVVGRTSVRTVRLDDVDGIECADLLALDVQGSEPAVLDGGSRVLASAFAVQVEMGFHRLYQDGPTFADVDVRLRAAGFVPHTFVSTRTWPLAPVGWHDPLEAHARHLVEADLLYVRDLARLSGLPEESLRRGAVVACGAYGSMGLGLRCVDELARRGTLPDDAPTRFRELVTTALDLAPKGGRRCD